MHLSSASFHRRTGRQELQADDLDADRSHRRPHDTGKHAEQRKDDEAGVVLAGKDPQEELSEARDECAEPGHVDFP